VRCRDSDDAVIALTDNLLADARPPKKESDRSDGSVTGVESWLVDKSTVAVLTPAGVIDGDGGRSSDADTDLRARAPVRPPAGAPTAAPRCALVQMSAHPRTPGMHGSKHDRLARHHALQPRPR
jgi:hypothetical protein